MFWLFFLVSWTWIRTWLVLVLVLVLLVFLWCSGFAAPVASGARRGADPRATMRRGLEEEQVQRVCEAVNVS
jgi:hypothetical protein